MVLCLILNELFIHIGMCVYYKMYVHVHTVAHENIWTFTIEQLLCMNVYYVKHF